MDIHNYKTEMKLRAIMYGAIGYTEKNGFWRKPKLIKKKHKKGQAQCAKCMEYFEKELLIPGTESKYYCIECEKAIILSNSMN